MTKQFIKSACACALALSALASTSRAAVTFSLDPDGSGAASGFLFNVATLDWAPDSALADGGLDAVRNFLAGGPAAGNVFETFTHGKLVGALTVSNVNLLPGGGVGEITFIAGITERVVLAAAGGGVVTAAFDLVTGPAVTNFFEVYWSAAVDSNPLTGTGYNNGTLIMSGKSTSFQGAASYTQSGLPTIMDANANGDQYGGQLTLPGGGSSQIVGVIDYIDSNFFQGLTAGATISFFTTQQKNPYDQADPSAAFYKAPGAGAPTTDGIGLGIPSIGVINGDLVTGGPDIQFQTDASTSFESTVPEPMSLLVWGGVALAAGGLIRHRRRASAN
jgi:hypothetical protein